MREKPDRLASNREQADRTTMHLLEFILSNLAHLRKVDQTHHMENVAKDIKVLMDNEVDITPSQRS